MLSYFLTFHQASQLVLGEELPQGGSLALLYQMMGGRLAEQRAVTADAVLVHEGFHDSHPRLRRTGIAGRWRDPQSGTCYLEVERDKAYCVMDYAGYLLTLACLSRLMRSPDVMQIHGSLLETKSGDGILLCGCSGMGKSTSARRWLQEGGYAMRMIW